MLNPHKIHIDVLMQDDLIMTLNEFHFIRRAFNKLIYIFFIKQFHPFQLKPHFS